MRFSAEGILTLCLASSVASAQPARSTTPPSPTSRPPSGAEWLARGARDAAARGDCASANDIARRAYKLDPTYYEQTLAHDPSISACVAAEPVSPPASAPVVVPDVAPIGSPVVAPVGSPAIALGGPSVGAPNVYAYAPASSVMQRPPEPEHVEPVSGFRVAGQSAAGILGTGAGLSAVAVALLIDAITCYDGDHNEESSDSCSDSATGWTIAFGLGAGLGAGLGVALAGLNDTGHASLPATMVGGLVGGVAAAFLVKSSNSESVTLGLFALPTAGALIGYYATRDHADTLPPPRIAPPPPAFSNREGTLIMPLGRVSF